VNAIAPIITITPMTEERVKREADRYEKMLVNIPMGRMGTIGDLIGPAIFLASAASDFVTGTSSIPTGGRWRSCKPDPAPAPGGKCGSSVESFAMSFL